MTGDTGEKKESERRVVQIEEFRERRQLVRKKGSSVKAPNEKDYPFLRKLLGLSIILITVFVGAYFLKQRDREIYRSLHRNQLSGVSSARTVPSPPLSEKVLATVRQCASKMPLFRKLQVAESANLDSILSEWTHAKSKFSKDPQVHTEMRVLEIITEKKEVWRLEMVPHAQLFVTSEGGRPGQAVPTAFPPSLQKLEGQSELTLELETLFKQFGSLRLDESQRLWSWKGGESIHCTQRGGVVADLQISSARALLTCVRSNQSEAECTCRERSPSGAKKS